MAAPSLTFDPLIVDKIVADKTKRIHFVGVGGTGVSALAQYVVQGGGHASGSDRSFDRGEILHEKKNCEAMGIAVFAQDGSGVPGSSLVVASTAIESTIADVVRARELGVPVISRAEMLAGFVRARKTIAIAGTSGKSTVVAMTFECLRAAGMDPGVITGGDLKLLKSDGQRGNAWYGSGPLVIEADESDKSLVHYEPEIGVLLNLQKDHDVPDAFIPVFDRFREQTRGVWVLGDDENLLVFRKAGATSRVLVFGMSPRSEIRGESITLERDGSRFMVGKTPVHVTVPGIHNVANAIAALAAAVAAGADLAYAAEGLAHYHGVSRRFECVGIPNGVEVIDDFAHNPSKIEATYRVALARAPRVLAVFSPHGYGPMRFMGDDIVDIFRRLARPGDRVYFPEIFYPGGSAIRDISSRSIIEKMTAMGIDAHFVPERRDLVLRLAADARPGDLVLLMGARDATLGEFATAVVRAIAAR